MSEVRKECRWSLRYGGRWYCKRPLFRTPEAGPTGLESGCPDRCPDYDPLPGKGRCYAPEKAAKDWENAS